MGSFNSAAYWDARYRDGESSGAGSRGRLADYKAQFVNSFILRNCVRSTLELGCGDGSQLEKLDCESYLGIDVSRTAIETCQTRFGGRAGFRFLLAPQVSEATTCELGLSLDVLYHLVEDDVFERYLRILFLLSNRYVIIYSSNSDSQSPAPHVRHRRVSAFIARRHPEWRMVAHLPNKYPFDAIEPEQTSFADFMVFVPRASRAETIIAV